jgi:hypothetical protein
MLESVKNALGLGTPAAPSPTSERDRQVAEIELELRDLRSKEPAWDLQVRAGRRDAEELAALRTRIANLERQLADLDAKEIAKIDRETRVRELMPARLDTIDERLRDRDALVEQLARVQADIEQTATAFVQDFANELGCVPPKAHELIALCRRWSPEFGPRSHALANYRARFERVVLGKKQPEPKPSALELMTPDEREELAERMRQQRRRHGQP